MTHPATPKPSRPSRILRTPDGVVSAKPIALRLQAAELAQIKEIASREQRSMASVCRLAILRGLADYPHSKLAA